MKLEPIEGGFAIDAADLGQLLDRPVGEVQQLMRAGTLTSRFERGEGEDAGRSRVTFFDETWHVRLVVSEDGEVIEHNRVRAARQQHREAGGSRARATEDRR